MTEPSLFGQRLKQTRERRQLSMQALADLAKVPYATIHRLETGRHQYPSLDVARRLARALGVGIDYFAGTFEEAEIEPASLEPALF
jgi:transcriptional regulator with XRE-family HTH domain